MGEFPTRIDLPLELVTEIDWKTIREWNSNKGMAKFGPGVTKFDEYVDAFERIERGRQAVT